LLGAALALPCANVTPHGNSRHDTKTHCPATARKPCTDRFTLRFPVILAPSRRRST